MMMGKLMDRLQKQLKTEHKKEAKDCMLLYYYLLERDKGHVWESVWGTLTCVIFKGYPSDERWYKPNDLGYLILAGLSKPFKQKFLYYILMARNYCNK